MSTIDTIKERIDIVEFISAYVDLRKAGRTYLGFCPFHPNARTPAFTVYPDTQSFHCFGCKASGTVFDFLMRREGLDFREALEQLARRAGVELQERSAEDQQLDQLRTRMLEINAAAARFFQHMLLSSARGAPARAYVEKRGIDAPTVEAFQLGYAPEEWSMLLAYLTDKRGFEPEDIEAAGLAIRREQGGYYDRFRNRLMFPIRSAKGEILSFGGRALGDAQPKYMNGPQTALFDKSRVLYGLDLARDPIRQSDAAVVVEGYVDVIVAHQHGYRNIVAPLGTALTGEHAGMLKKLAKRIYLALDADPAGIRATLKGVDTLREHADGHDVAVPTPGGYIRWEREADTEIRVIGLPDGRDPDEVIQADPGLWPQLVERARPVMDFYITALTADLDLSSGKGKAEAVKRLAPLLAQIANPVEQAHHVQQIARLIQVGEHVVQQSVAQAQQPARPARGKPTAPVAAPVDTQPNNEDFLVGVMIRYPTARTAVQEKLRRDLAGFPLLAQVIEGAPLELLDRPDNRVLWQSWERQFEGTAPEDWLATLDPALKPQAERALTLQVPSQQLYRFVNDALECATILQLRLARRWKDRLSQPAADDAVDEVAEVERLIQVQNYINALSVPKRSSTYADLHTLRTV
ncbi:MAG TPA: DNA primase [Roseiflexaceae bacterium]|nr:DNA primase [Roseiflexaceae bacterium]